MFPWLTCTPNGTAIQALRGSNPVLPQGEQVGKTRHPSQYLGGFDLVSTAAAPPRQVREHLTLLPPQTGLHLTPPLLQDDGGCGAGSTGHSWAVKEAYLPTNRRLRATSPFSSPNSGLSKEATLFCGTITMNFISASHQKGRRTSSREAGEVDSGVAVISTEVPPSVPSLAS